MKKIFLAALMMVMTIGANAQAQDDNGRGQRRQMNRQQMVEFRMERMTQELSLNAEQQSKIKTILMEEMESMPQRGEMKQGERPSREAMEQMRAKHEEQNKKIESLLNDEQKTKFQEMNKRRGGHGQRGGGPRGQRPQRMQQQQQQHELQQNAE